MNGTVFARCLLVPVACESPVSAPLISLCVLPFPFPTPFSTSSGCYYCGVSSVYRMRLRSCLGSVVWYLSTLSTCNRTYVWMVLLLLKFEAMALFADVGGGISRLTFFFVCVVSFRDCISGTIDMGPPVKLLCIPKPCVKLERIV